MTNRKSLASKSLIGIQAIGPSSFNDNKNSGAVFGANLWRKFIESLIERNLPLNQVMYGVSWPADELTPPQEIHYFCGIESIKKIEGLTTLKLEGGEYFEYKCEVPADEMDRGFQEAYMYAFPQSGLEGREGQHLEIYGEDYDPNSPIANFTILIPVK